MRDNAAYDDDLAAIILDCVSSGRKATELVSETMSKGIAAGSPPDPDSYTLTLAGLIAQGEIIEVEYIIPQMDYRCKSFYLPKGTLVRILRPDDAPPIGSVLGETAIGETAIGDTP